ncbi:hypothetical protein NLI96_g6318 [Meripilus lineatus]|uniref:Uncharacterized protein n=1 Tax=Meripilus lineatus TaxID=2056292 RepID=A0AAD5YG19_9APHY|nr:hypothetical protein NLI96_g6318 [Physisporinus lineatus]
MNHLVRLVRGEVLGGLAFLFGMMQKMGVYGKAADDERELNKTLSLGFGHRSGVHVDELIWTTSGSLVKEKWGEELGYLLGATDVGSSEEQDWVPREEGDLESWGFLGRKLGSHDRTRRHALMYIDSGVSTSRTQVSLRVQGFVERASLATLGNWQGSESHAPKAIQSLLLGPGKQSAAAFAEQNKAIALVKDFIKDRIGYPVGEASSRKSDSEKLFLQRRVFTRVREGDEYIELLRSEDPSGDAAKIRSRWAVSTRMEIGRRTRDGKIVRCASYLIRPGDFVEAIVVFDIATYGTGKGSGCQVHLGLEQLVQIQPRKDQTVDTACDKDKLITKGFVFEDDLHADDAEDGMRVDAKPGV